MRRPQSVVPLQFRRLQVVCTQEWGCASCHYCPSLLAPLEDAVVVAPSVRVEDAVVHRRHFLQLLIVDDRTTTKESVTPNSLLKFRRPSQELRQPPRPTAPRVNRSLA
jgi:hypothetical protein